MMFMSKTIRAAGLQPVDEQGLFDRLPLLQPGQGVEQPLDRLRVGRRVDGTDQVPARLGWRATRRSGTDVL